MASGRRAEARRSPPSPPPRDRLSKRVGQRLPEAKARTPLTQEQHGWGRGGRVVLHTSVPGLYKPVNNYFSKAGLQPLPTPVPGVQTLGSLCHTISHCHTILHTQYTVSHHCTLCHTISHSVIRSHTISHCLTPYYTVHSATPSHTHGFDPWSMKIPHASGQESPRTTTIEPACCNY